MNQDCENLAEWDLDIGRNELVASEAFYALYGLSPGDVLDVATLRNVIDGELRGGVRSQARKAIRRGNCAISFDFTSPAVGGARIIRRCLFEYNAEARLERVVGIDRIMHRRMRQEQNRPEAAIGLRLG